MWEYFWRGFAVGVAVGFVITTAVVGVLLWIDEKRSRRLRNLKVVKR